MKKYNIIWFYLNYAKITTNKCWNDIISKIKYAKIKITRYLSKIKNLLLIFNDWFLVLVYREWCWAIYFICQRYYVKCFKINYTMNLKK